MNINDLTRINNLSAQSRTEVPEMPRSTDGPSFSYLPDFNKSALGVTIHSRNDSLGTESEESVKINFLEQHKPSIVRSSFTSVESLTKNFMIAQLPTQEFKAPIKNKSILKAIIKDRVFLN